jgi:hypothetical protein
MTLQQFCSATHYVQRTIVRFHGILLLERKVGNRRAKLYQLDGFYVEVFFVHDSAKVFLIKSHPDANEIEDYLSIIDISEVLTLFN